MTVQKRVNDLMRDCLVLIDVQETRQAIAAAISAAVAEEREACAKIVETYEGDDWPHAAAAAIRGVLTGVQ